MSLIVNHLGQKITVDHFFKTLLFQRIMDDSFSRMERDVLLVIFRKTIHFDKWKDRICMYSLSKMSGVGRNRLFDVVKQLESKMLIEVDRSSGGKSESSLRFNGFQLSLEFLGLVVNQWLEIKEDNDFI